MESKIFKLPSSVINQIAAGEVVENPASIVKELIENSLDAGATRIGIEVVDGGQSLIRIEDNGSGMSERDALLSIERHATSKIQETADLQTLSTMGFRGEALAAISSVCHFEMRTCQKKGTRIVADGGSVSLVEPCARNPGTTIEVRSLFYNVPARKKFQKSKSADAAAVTKIVEMIALANERVSFTLNGKELLSRRDEILKEFEHQIQGKGIYGYIAEPAKAGQTRRGQYLFINKRPIFSPLIAKAVKSAFGTRIAEHSHPKFVLFLEMSPDLVDVNVHPQKKEVRFKDESAIFRLVHTAVEKAFAPKKTFSDPIAFNQPISTGSFTENFPSMPLKAFEPELDWIFPQRPLAVFGKYLLLQKEGLLLVDLSSAFARLLFESFVLEAKSAQALMFPLQFPFENGDEEIVEKLMKIGVEARLLKNTLVIDALPNYLEAADFDTFFDEWKVGRKLEEIATKYSRRSKRKFTLEQGTKIWQEVQMCKDPLYDPLGNPIFIHLNEDDFAKLMGKRNG